MAPTLANPSTPEEWTEWCNTALATPEDATKLINSGEFRDKVIAYGKAYAEKSNKTMADLKAQVEESVTASVMDLFKRNGHAPDSRPDVRPAATAVQARAQAAYDPQAPGVEVGKIWNSSGQMLQDLLTPTKRQSKEQRARFEAYEDFKAAYSGNVPSTGGYLVPEEVRSDIMTAALPEAVVRPQATVVPMPTSKLRWPVVDMTTLADGTVYGGIQMVWLDEGQTFTATEAAFGTIGLEAHKLGGLATVPNELVRHISVLETWLRANLPNALRHFEDVAFIKGNGVGKPLGGLHASNPALIVADDEAGQSTASITWNNVLAMFARLLPDSYGNAEWDITPDAIPEIMSMALPVGTGGSAVMLGEGGGPNKLPMTMLGMGIRWTQKAPAVMGIQGDISLADWSKYVIGDTKTLQLDTSEHSAFRSDSTDFRILEEVDGQPGMLSAITPENGGPTLSAWIQLESRNLD
jgi:HK97 family phage major capsid protein